MVTLKKMVAVVTLVTGQFCFPFKPSSYETFQILRP